MTSHSNCPDIFDFSFQKTERVFSKMGQDQLHDQNNNLIKSNGGATHLLNRDNSAALEKWEVTTPEIAMLLSEFEKVNEESV